MMLRPKDPPFAKRRYVIFSLVLLLLSAQSFYITRSSAQFGPRPDGITATGVDGVTYAGTNGITATGVDSLSMARADGITATGVDGITITGVDGRSYNADSVFLRMPNGITATGVDGITATGVDGITATGVDGITATGVDGITATGVDGITITGVDGITATGVDGRIFNITPSGITITGVDGITATGVDNLSLLGFDSIVSPLLDGLTSTLIGKSYAHADGITATGVDGITATGVDGITATGVDGITITGVDGTTYRASSVFASMPDGITATGVDGITATGVDGINILTANAINMAHANGITATGVDGITITGADGITATGVDGTTFKIAPSGITITGLDGFFATNVSGLSLAGIDGLSTSGLVDSLQPGLQALDSDLRNLLNTLTDDSSVNAAIVYHQLPDNDDLQDLMRLGLLGGTRYRVLPVIIVSGTRKQLDAVAKLKNVRAIYGNRTLQPLADAGGGQTGTERAAADADLRGRNDGRAYTGRGVTVAVLDTGIDATHADLAGRIANNVKVASTLGVGVGFLYPVNLENLPTTDLVGGHGTFVAGIVSGNGARSKGKYTGVATGAKLLGVSAGDLSLFHVLEGYDYILSRGLAQGVRVVNCSFSADTEYNPNDPVNVATKLLTEQGVSVVFSAGNTGPGLGTLNPYATAPWVIGVGATNGNGKLTDFSSRGRFGQSGPTLVAPGQSVVSLRALASLNPNGILSLATGEDLSKLSLAELPYYMTGSGTSFSTPQVAGAIALLLEANPLLTPDAIRDLLQRTATPLPPYYRHEVGAGMLNVHAALLEAAFSARHMGTYRAALDRGQARFTTDGTRSFSGTVQPGTTSSVKLPIPAGTLLAGCEIAWASLLNFNDLRLAFYDPLGVKRAEANALNLPGLTGYHEGVTVREPMAGTWEAQIRHSLSLLATSQPYTGRLSLTRVEYAPMNDLGSVSQTARAEIEESLRSYAMAPLGQNFRPGHTVSRRDFAQSLLVGARVPQYLAGKAQFSDVRDLTGRATAESAQANPGGAIFYDATPGGRFRPDEAINRLTAAVALVRAAGLRSEAEKNLGLLFYSDAWQIPSEWRGYVAVAVSRGLITVSGSKFAPQQALTRGELAHALAVIADLATK